MKRNCKRQTKKYLRQQKAINRKGDKLYVKRKDYNNSFNNWIDKKDIVQNESTFF